MSELNELIAERDKVQAELREIESVDEEGRNRILDAIGSQRWYFFVNNQYILMDRDTGLLWANLDYFDYRSGEIVNFDERSGLSGWRVPTPEEMIYMIQDGTFPFRTTSGHIKDNAKNYWKISTKINSRVATGDLNLETLRYDSTPAASSWLIPCNRSLIIDTIYARNVDPQKSDYSKRERLQFTLDLFVNNNLWPKFNDSSITDLYDRIYMRKASSAKKLPALTAKLQELNAQIEAAQTPCTLSSEFDYTALLANYDLNAIALSVIKYFQALQNWTDELMSLIETYDREKEDTISVFNMVSLQLSKKYEDSPDLTHEENEFLRERTAFFRRKLSLGMNTAKTKILAVKSQADELEDRIDSTDSLTELAAISREDRAPFPLVAENTARIIRNALLKVEYFESHREFVVNAVKIIAGWTEDYRVFRTSRRKDLENTCKSDGIDPQIWEEWYSGWQGLRLAVERKVQPMLEYGLKGDVPVSGESDKSIPEQVIAVLGEYKAAIDSFFLEERKGIYQKYAFAPGGGLQEKFETEAELYKRTSRFQADLQRVIFSCTRPADRIFILNWADSLLDTQVDEVLGFVADEGLDKISAEILDKFARLKQKNYDVYLNDAKAYGEELSRREKEYNSLVFKMRQDLAKKEGH